MSAVVSSAADVRRSRVRLFIVTMLFLVTTVNYADRATLSIAGPALSKELHLDPVAMGWIFSAFGWSYVAAQVPGGWLLDRYGSRLVYAFSIIVWSLFTMMQGWVASSAPAPPSSCCSHFASLSASRKRPRSPPTPASSPPGFPAMSAAPHRPSSIRDSISPP